MATFTPEELKRLADKCDRLGLDVAAALIRKGCPSLAAVAIEMGMGKSKEKA